MALRILRTLALVLSAACVCRCMPADDIEMELRSGVLIKMLRITIWNKKLEMVNQTKADTMNLPANSTSIRENITDTFSCENRTYGYYADVDNECQIFHVCLPSQAPTGRNMTYRWSFICPAETVFNQEVLTCTRPRDAIACEDSPMFYDVNMEFGKVSNNSKAQAAPESKPESESEPSNSPASNTEAVASTPQRWNQANRKKQNIVAQTFLKDGNIKSRKQDIKDYGNKIMEAIKENIKDYNHNVVLTMNQEFSELNQGIQGLKEEIKEVEKDIINETDEIKESEKEKTQTIKDNVKEIIQDEEVMDNIKRIITNELKQSAMQSDGEIQPSENEQTVELPPSVLRNIEAMN
ncbi:unnamed protein product, partial [Iphiclides podalirius]